MKKGTIALLVTICLCMVTPAQAQFNWGVKGGLNVSKMSFETNFLSSENSTGFFIGPMAEFTIPFIGLGIDAALLYSQKDIKMTAAQIDVSEKMQGLDIPVNLKYTIIGLGSIGGIYLAAGPDFFFNFSKDIECTHYWGMSKRKMQIGLNVGGGIKLINHLQIGVNYTIQLNDPGVVELCYTDVVAGYNYKVKTWQVSVAYLF